MVDKIAAYVDGRPIPFSSSSLTRVASENRGGGWVKCCSGLVSSSFSESPSLTSGSDAPVSSSLTASSTVSA